MSAERGCFNFQKATTFQSTLKANALSNPSHNVQAEASKCLHPPNNIWIVKNSKISVLNAIETLTDINAGQ
ncbi:hypothetical protein NQZ68_023073 [Dissostichus eleginoides]|nr:hypothetical protein NQZ68_023073 [Dissostichus eleginoides]